MINIDNLERFITEELDDGEHFSLRKEGWIELITRLHEAEMDAVRYRWLRDQPDWTTVENIASRHGDIWNEKIDQAMKGEGYE